MRYEKIDNKLFTENRNKLIQKIGKNSVAIIHSAHEMPRNGDQYFPHRQNSDFFYLSGIEQENSILVLCPDHPDKNLREILFIEQADETKERWFGYRLKKEEAIEISGIQNIRFTHEFDFISRNLILNSENIFLNLNEFVKYSDTSGSNEHKFVQKIKNKYPLHTYMRLAPLITNLRLIKSEKEIEILQKAIDITEKAFRRVLKNTKPGMKEYQVEAEITHEFISNGANGHGYYPIIANGKNGQVLHYIKNNEICQSGEMLLMDFGAEYANYTADCSRTIPVNGKFTPRQRQVYEAVLRVLKQAQKMLIPGTIVDEYNKQVRRLMQEECIALGLFTREEVNKQDTNNPLVLKYFMHGTSHFLGLDVHDVGSYYQPLEKGMVLTCEPALYIEEENIAIRLEDNIMVDNEPVNLMRHIPIEPDEIEKLMSNY